MKKSAPSRATFSQLFQQLSQAKLAGIGVFLFVISLPHYYDIIYIDNKGGMSYEKFS